VALRGTHPAVLAQGKLTNGVGCPGQYRTFDEAWAIKQQLDATGKQFPD
jgi:hypothetical protein